MNNYYEEIPVSQELPDTEGYFMTIGSVMSSYWHNDTKEWEDTGVTAWLKKVATPVQGTVIERANDFWNENSRNFNPQIATKFLCKGDFFSFVESISKTHVQGSTVWIEVDVKDRLPVFIPDNVLMNKHYVVANNWATCAGSIYFDGQKWWDDFYNSKGEKQKENITEYVTHWLEKQSIPKIKEVDNLLEIIKCPECNFIQPAQILISDLPFNIYIHHCENCEYVIMESEWEVFNPNKLPLPESHLELAINKTLDLCGSVLGRKELVQRIISELPALPESKGVDM